MVQTQTLAPSPPIGAMRTQKHEQATRQLAQDIKRMQGEVRCVAHSIAEADLDGACELDFEEFSALAQHQWKESLTTQQLEVLFTVSDSDGNGSVSVTESFIAALASASIKVGFNTLKALILSLIHI